MRKVLSNRFVDALAKTILFFGSVHLMILGIAAILRGDLSALNAFNILSLDLFLPGLAQGIENFILSYCIVAGVYILAYRFMTKQAED